MNTSENNRFIFWVFFGGGVIIAVVLILVFFVIIPLFTNKPGTDEFEPGLVKLETKDVAGIWNNTENLSADWGDRYHFWESGTYSFYFNRTKDPKSRLVGYYGYWKAENGKIIVTPAIEILLTGGSYDERTLNYIGAETEEKDTSAPRKEIAIKRCKAVNSTKHKCFAFEDEKFYKFSDNASTYFDFKIASEPQLKIARNITSDISGNYSYKETGVGESWNYSLNIYKNDIDFFGDLKITGPNTNINVVTKIDGSPDGKLNILFDSYKGGSPQKLFTKCYRKNCGREVKTGDILFTLEKQGNRYNISWGEFYPYVEKNRDSKTEFFSNQ